MKDFKALHVHISNEGMLEQFLTNNKKRITRQTKGQSKFSDNIFGKHPRGRKYDSSHGRR